MSEDRGSQDGGVRYPLALRPLRLLVVDDNRINRLLLSSLLGRLGHQVDVAESGEAAVEQVRRQPYDAVLMDFLMPGMDGFAATAAIRALQGGAADTVVIGVSADIDDRPDPRPARCGMNATVGKPIQREQLLRALDACLAEPAHQLSQAASRRIDTA